MGIGLVGRLRSKELYVGKKLAPPIISEASRTVAAILMFGLLPALKFCAHSPGRTAGKAEGIIGMVITNLVVEGPRPTFCSTLPSTVRVADLRTESYV